MMALSVAPGSCLLWGVTTEEDDVVRSKDRVVESESRVKVRIS